jgi:hypothetical protein
MKIAFLVLNHRHPAQLVRLLTALRSQLPDAPIVVHHDIFHGEISSKLIEPIGNVHLLTSGKRMSWGDFSITDVCCWSLTWMREHIEFDWMVLLSAQDYPIKPLADFADYLTMNGADAVFQAAPIDRQPTARRILMHRRYYFQYQTAGAGRSRRKRGSGRGPVRRVTWTLVQVANIVQPLFKLYPLPDGMPYRLGWRSRKAPFSRDRPCWQGSQWFALSRSALEYSLDAMAAQPEFVDYYRRTMVPDESMIATLVCNAPNLRVADRGTTYTRWASDMTPHPDIFRVADLAELVAAPQYFARKFDINEDTRILDALDDFIGARV